MVVVSDTTTITNLLKIDLLHLVQRLYREIIIPQAVYDELAKIPSQKKLLKQTNWIRVRQVKDRMRVDKFQDYLDLGESEAIILALELNADILIMDERKGRKIAEEYGLAIIGLFGILIGAKRRGHIKSVKSHMDTLINDHSFRVNEAVYNQVLRLAKES